MALYNEKTVVVIDDNIYDLMELYKSVLCRKEFGISPDKLNFIKFSDLSATIPADRLSDFRMIFYIFEKINSAEEYKAVTDKLQLSVNVDVTLLHCQDDTAFKACGCRKNSEYCNVHCIGINHKFTLNKGIELSPEEQQSRNCLYLSAMLYYLLSLDVGAFSDYSFDLEINYPSVYCATQYPIIQVGERVLSLEEKIKNEKHTIETLKQEKPRKYSLDFSKNKIDEKLANVSFSGEESEEALKELSAICADCESEIGKTIARDINAVRYAMAEMDEFARGGAEPDFHRESTDGENIPTVDDLLRNVELADGSSLNAKQAINVAKGLVKTEKPKIKPFIIGAGVAIALFLICVAIIYGVNIVKNGAASLDKLLLVVCLCVPVAAIVIAGIIGFIINLFEFRKIRGLIANIRSNVQNRARGFGSLVEKVRAYLNDYLTVFCNFHAKDFSILQSEKRIGEMEKEKEEIIATLEKNNCFADDIKKLYAYEMSLRDDDFDNTEGVDNLYKEKNDGHNYLSDFDSFDHISPQEVEITVQSQKKAELKTCADCKQCVDFIMSQCNTAKDGNESDIFKYTQSPWLTAIKISDNMNGGMI